MCFEGTLLKRESKKALFFCFFVCSVHTTLSLAGRQLSHFVIAVEAVWIVKSTTCRLKMWVWSVPQTKLYRGCAFNVQSKKLNFPSAFSGESCWLIPSHARCPVKSLWIEESACKTTMFGEDLSALAQFMESKLQLFPFPLSINPSVRQKTGVSRGAALPVKQQMAHRHSSQTKRVRMMCVKPLSHPCATFKIFENQGYTHPSQWEGRQ